MSARRRERGREAAAGPSQRQLRVGEEVRHALVEVLRDGHARDPDLRDVNITVTEVRISPDLANATAYVMPLGGRNIGSVLAALNRASAYFRTQLAHAVQLRHVPRIAFEVDSSFSYAERIEGLLHRPEVERDLHHDPNHPGAEGGESD